MTEIGLGGKVLAAFLALSGAAVLPSVADAQQKFSVVHLEKEISDTKNIEVVRQEGKSPVFILKVPNVEVKSKKYDGKYNGVYEIGNSKLKVIVHERDEKDLGKVSGDLAYDLADPVPESLVDGGYEAELVLEDVPNKRYVRIGTDLQRVVRAIPLNLFTAATPASGALGAAGVSQEGSSAGAVVGSITSKTKERKIKYKFTKVKAATSGCDVYRYIAQGPETSEEIAREFNEKYPHYKDVTNVDLLDGGGNPFKRAIKKGNRIYIKRCNSKDDVKTPETGTENGATQVSQPESGISELSDGRNIERVQAIIPEQEDLEERLNDVRGEGNRYEGGVRFFLNGSHFNPRFSSQRVRIEGLELGFTAIPIGYAGKNLMAGVLVGYSKLYLKAHDLNRNLSLGEKTVSNNLLLGLPIRLDFGNERNEGYVKVVPAFQYNPSRIDYNGFKLNERRIGFSFDSSIALPQLVVVDRNGVAVGVFLDANGEVLDVGQDIGLFKNDYGTQTNLSLAVGPSIRLSKVGLDARVGGRFDSQYDLSLSNDLGTEALSNLSRVYKRDLSGLNKDNINGFQLFGDIKYVFLDDPRLYAKLRGIFNAAGNLGRDGVGLSLGSNHFDVALAYQRSDLGTTAFGKVSDKRVMVNITLMFNPESLLPRSREETFFPNLH